MNDVFCSCPYNKDTDDYDASYVYYSQRLARFKNLSKAHVMHYHEFLN